MDTEAIAARLYGGTTPTAAPVLSAAAATSPSPAGPSRAESVAAVAAAAPSTQATAQSPKSSEPASKPNGEPPGEVKVQVPDEIAKLRDTPERRLFNAQTAFSAVPVEEWGWLAESKADDAVKGAVAREFREHFHDVGASLDEVNTMTATLAKIDGAQEVTDQTVADWTAESLRQVSARYGENADQVLADAKALARRDARFGRLLVATGLGSHPAVVMFYANAAQRQRRR